MSPPPDAAASRPAAARSAIPVRFARGASGVAVVEGNVARWRCSCATHPVLAMRTGAVGGPTPESTAVCPACGKSYFVIPFNESGGRPIEVVELLASAPA